MTRIQFVRIIMIITKIIIAADMETITRKVIPAVTDNANNACEVVDFQPSCERGPGTRCTAPLCADSTKKSPGRKY